ncbi:TonB-dependent receptor [uncultured Arcticibacterium sp.]|uniref:SusC/RagA family TonB-linked outer membrane protein n=1 Tax=uncultured Arcticibacterium sp. TaxID=2173042 RepID=UPI0030F7789E
MNKLRHVKLFLIFTALLFGNQLYAQDKISGMVTDETGEALVGVNVIVKGTTTGTMTNVDGKYEIGAAKGSTLVYSFIGFNSQEVAILNQKIIDISLKEGSVLDEVIVVGYGKAKKSTLTGAVAAIDNKQLTAVPVANTANLLGGRVPGVMTRQSTGLPGGEDTQIRIRGFAKPPLTLVDGVQMDFSRVDPNDIESITILKDAAAAVYGARAGNGVVLVTTKRGKTGKARISYAGSYTSQSAAQFLEQVNPEQYVQLFREADLMDGNGYDFTFNDEEQQKYRDGVPNYEGGDWVNALIKNNAPMTQHNLSVSGGSENISYFTSVGLTDQESYFRSRDFDYGRINARSNIDAKINKNLSFNLDLSYRTEQTNRSISGVPNLSDLWTELSTTQPILPTELPDPTIGYPYTGFSQRNPVTSSTRSIRGTWDRTENLFRGKLGLTFKVPFIDGLTAKAEINTQQYDRAIKQFTKPAELYQYLPASDTYVLEGTQNPVSTISDSQYRRNQIYPLISLEYAKQVNDHSFKILGIAEQTTQKFNSLSASRRELLSTAIPELFIGSTDQQFNYGFSGSDIGRKSVVGRLNYGYKDKYLFESTFRADGNVLFAPETRWGYFPSFSAAWVMSEESFMKSNKVVDFLKLRLAYSQLGDDTADGLTGFDYLTGYDLNGIYIFDQSAGFPRISTRGLVNPLLSWEVLTMYNLGLETSVLNGKLTLEAELFYRKRDGIIDVNIEDVPSTFGAALPVVNINSQDSRGIELSAYYRQNVGKFKFDLSPNFSIAKSKWLEVKSQENFTDPDLQRINGLDGNWVNRRFGYVSDGIFMSQEEVDSHQIIQDGNGNTTLRPGDIKYKDLNDDGEIDFRDQDLIGFAAGIPELMYGMNIGIDYGNFRLSGLLQGASRFGMAITAYARDMFSNGSTPLTYHFENRWQPDPNNPGVNINPNASLPAATQAPGSNNGKFSDFYYRNVNYLRLKNVNLSYNLPSSFLAKAGIESAQIYIAAENIFTLTNLGFYSNSFDPEFDPSVGGTGYNVPITKSQSIGLRLGL